MFSGNSLISLRCVVARLPLVRVGSQSLSQRWVGTQTPLWRARQEAAAKARPVRQTSSNLPYEGKTLLSEGDPKDLVSRAFDAARVHNEFECASLIWTLKDLPRDAKVREAVDTPLGTPARTLLQEVAAQGLERPVSFLLEMAANVKHKDEHGRTALHMAALRNRGKVTKLLCSHGRANVNAKDSHGRTPLHLATDHGSTKAAKILVRFGADPRTVDGAGRMAIDDKTNAKGRTIPNRKDIVNWMKTCVVNREEQLKQLGEVEYYTNQRLPAHIVAPKLVLTPVGYCPEEDGKVIQLARGIRFKKRRRGPSAASCRVNWYAPRG